MVTSVPPTRTTLSLSTSTLTKYWTSTYPGGSTITYSTIIETGVLSTDKTRPSDAFSHNTGAIIGITLAGTFALVILALIIFFTCRKYKQRESIASGSRENFLRRDVDIEPPAWRSPLEGDDDEFEQRYGYRGLGFGSEGTGAAATGVQGGVMQENPGAGSVSYSAYPHDSGGSGENGGAGIGNEGLSGSTSAESALMFPPQGHVYPGMGGVDSYVYMPPSGVVVPPIPGPSSPEGMTHATRSSPPPEPGLWLSASPTQPGFALPYQHPQQAASRSTSDPFGDGHAAPAVAISSTSGHGHPSSDALASSVYLGSSSHGHLVNTVGAGGTWSSSSGHGVSGGRSKSASPAAERRSMAPPSSYVPPRGGMADSSDSSGSGSDRSSVRDLFGRFRSLSKGKGKERDRSKSLQNEGVVSRSSGESMASRRSMSMSVGHSTTLGHTSVYSHGHPHAHGQPSSLLNPPNPLPMSMPRSDVLPVPVIQYPEIAEPSPMGYPYSIPDQYQQPPAYSQHGPRNDLGLTSDSPYVDICPPPTTFRPPSPVPTDASSYVEGLLNPRMLPGGSAGLDTFDIGGSRGGNVGDRRGSRGIGRHSLGMSEDGGGSVMSLRDNVDYSRPISGAAMQGMRSTTTFGTDTEVVGAGIGGGGGSLNGSAGGSGRRGSGNTETEGEGDLVRVGTRE